MRPLFIVTHEVGIENVKESNLGSGVRTRGNVTVQDLGATIIV